VAAHSPLLPHPPVDQMGAFLERSHVSLVSLRLICQIQDAKEIGNAGDVDVDSQSIRCVVGLLEAGKQPQSWRGVGLDPEPRPIGTS